MVLGICFVFNSGVNMIKNSGGTASNGANGHKVGNVNVQIGDKEGIYAGSASNMARLFIFCNVVWAILFGVFAYYEGIRQGNLESRIEFLERSK